ncbi:MAG: DUF4124 domain-containing protein [Burkholderiales bacterium]|nr:DUF4124 domain-containing protein [Burkholderiales bacterium]
MMNRLILLLILCATIASSHADVYKSKDPAGKTVFSDSPSTGATKLDIPLPPAKAPEPVEGSAAPEISEKDAVDEKRKTLQGALDAATGKLDAAKIELKRAQDSISGTERNNQDDIDRTAAIEEEIARQEKAVEDLRKSISDLK